MRHRRDTGKLRREIAYQAARMMYERQESEYYRAKIKAARRIAPGWVKPADLPSNAEVREQIQLLARMHEGDSRKDHLLNMRLAALRMMRRLERFHPRLIGSVWTGYIRQGSDIDLHLFTDSVASVTSALEADMLLYDVQRKEVRKNGEHRVFTHVHVFDEYPFELTVYGKDKQHFTFKCSITHKPIQRASLAQLEQFLQQEYPDVDLEQELELMDSAVDRFQLYYSLLLPLENVKQHPKHHPEGDVLYHSLQVFEHARDALPYDEEFLLAALLHDIGKGLDPDDHVESGLEALAGFITPRTAWLIQHHMVAHHIADGTLGARARKRLQENDSYEELLLLQQCDRDGRECGVEVCELEEALDYIRELAHLFG